MNAEDCGFLVVPGSKFPEMVFHGSRADQEEFVKAVLLGFGDPPDSAQCRCHPAVNHVGSVVAIHLCPPHQFANEVDSPGRCVEWTTPTRHGGFAPHSYGALSATVSRADRMMFARSMRMKWLAQEGLLQHCRSCDQVYMDAQHSCVRKMKALPW